MSILKKPLITMPNMPSNSTSMMFFYTYVLLSAKDDEYYIGYTNDLKRRLEEHNLPS